MNLDLHMLFIKSEDLSGINYILILI